MTVLVNKLRFALIAFVLLFAVPVCAAELPSDSIYRLGVPLVDQDGRGFRLAQRSGRVQLVTMFYSSCQYSCPLTIDTLRKAQTALTPAERAKLDILMISFDPARDTPVRLKQVLRERKLDAASWTLARAEASAVRKIAAALDIQYRALANGDISHSSALVLLDAQGRVLARSEGLGTADAAFMAALHGALGTH